MTGSSNHWRRLDTLIARDWFRRSDYHASTSRKSVPAARRMDSVFGINEVSSVPGHAVRFLYNDNMDKLELVGLLSGKEPEAVTRRWR